MGTLISAFATASLGRSGFSGEMYGGGTAPVGSVIVLRTGAAAPVSASFTAGGDTRAAAIEYDGGRLALK